MIGRQIRGPSWLSPPRPRGRKVWRPGPFPAVTAGQKAPAIGSQPVRKLGAPPCPPPIPCAQHRIPRCQLRRVAGVHPTVISRPLTRAGRSAAQPGRRLGRAGPLSIRRCQNRTIAVQPCAQRLTATPGSP